MKMDQIISIIGALLILVAYGLLQAKKIQKDSHLYLSLNLLGGLGLFYAAYVARQVGFMILEGSWTLISLRGFMIRDRSH